MISKDDLIIAAIFWTTFIISARLFKARKHRRELPPGFMPLPVVGNLFNLLMTEPHLFITKVGRHFGGIVTIYLGDSPVVVFNRLDQAVEAFVKHDHVFSDRRIPSLLEKSFSSRGSVLWENGTEWRLHRQSIHSGLRHIDTSGDNLSSKVISEVAHLFAKLDQKLDKPLDLSESLVTLSARVVCSVSFGRRFDSSSESKSFEDFRLGVKYIATKFSVFSLALIFPPLYDTFLYSEVRSSVEHVKTFLGDVLSEHKTAFQDNTIRDVMDAYCDVIMRKGQVEGIHTSLDERFIWRTFFDLMGAGTDTTANSLLWGIMYMCGHPEYQEKIAEELTEAPVGSEYLSDEDEARWPLTCATILEIMRCATVVPLGVPRVTTRDVRICDYDIPKGTEVWLNQYAINNDENLWEEPAVFRPERFLNATGDSILTLKRNQLVSFGLGRRICIGKKLAEKELFIVFSNLFKRYRLRFADPHQKIDRVGVTGLTYSPKPFDVILEKRTKSH